MLSYPPFSPMTVSADTVAEGVVRSGPPEAQDRVAPEENGRSGNDGTKRADVGRKIIDAAPGCEDDRLPQLLGGRIFHVKNGTVR